jgi:hypothetical protein
MSHFPLNYFQNPMKIDALETQIVNNFEQK